MNEFFKSFFGRVVGGVALTLLLAGGSIIFGSIKEKHFPSTAYVNQQVEYASAEIMAEMIKQEKDSAEAFKEIGSGLDDFSNGQKRVEESLLLLQQDMEYVKLGMKEIKDDQKESIREIRADIKERHMSN